MPEHGETLSFNTVVPNWAVQVATLKHSQKPSCLTGLLGRKVSNSLASGLETINCGAFVRISWGNIE